MSARAASRPIARLSARLCRFVERRLESFALSNVENRSRPFRQFFVPPTASAADDKRWLVRQHAVRSKTGGGFKIVRHVERIAAGAAVRVCKR